MSSLDGVVTGVIGEGVAASPNPVLGWVGRYEDIIKGKPGQYVIRLADNKKEWDTSYPGVEILNDGNILTTTYGHWIENQAPYIISIRIKAEELDELGKRSHALEIEKSSMRLKL